VRRSGAFFRKVKPEVVVLAAMARNLRLNEIFFSIKSALLLKV
jgi:hypothetical protein